MQNNFNKLDSFRSILSVFIDPFVFFAASKFKYCSMFISCRCQPHAVTLFAQRNFTLSTDLVVATAKEFTPI